MITADRRDDDRVSGNELAFRLAGSETIRSGQNFQVQSFNAVNEASQHRLPTQTYVNLEDRRRFLSSSPTTPNAREHKKIGTRFLFSHLLRIYLDLSFPFIAIGTREYLSPLAMCTATTTPDFRCVLPIDSRPEL